MSDKTGIESNILNWKRIRDGHVACTRTKMQCVCACVWGRVNENGSLKSIWQDKWGPNFLRKQAIQKRRQNTFKNHS